MAGGLCTGRPAHTGGRVREPLAWPLEEAAAKRRVFRPHAPSPGGWWAGSRPTSSAENRPDAQAAKPGQGWSHALWSCKPSRTFHRPSGCIHPSAASPLDSRRCKRALKNIPEEQSSSGVCPVAKRRARWICAPLSEARSAPHPRPPQPSPSIECVSKCSRDLFLFSFVFSKL